jgi:hypothetical protein
MEKLGTDEGEYHIPLPVNSPTKLCEYQDTVSTGSYVGQLMTLLVPYSLRKYPGKLGATSKLLSVPVSVVRLYGRAGGNANLTAPVARRGEKICRELIARLSILADQFRDHALTCEAKRAPIRRGFLTVRVRDDSGIPRTAQGPGHGNGVILAENNLPRQKPKPF